MGEDELQDHIMDELEEPCGSDFTGEESYKEVDNSHNEAGDEEDDEGLHPAANVAQSTPDQSPANTSGLHLAEG
jgi:hypothetical protein